MKRHLLTASVAAILCFPMIAAAAADPGTAASAAAGAPTPAQASAPDSLAPHGDIADTLKASGQFTILSKALDQTNLTSVLKGAGPLTLIAPTDAAFQALPAGALDNLMKPENAQQLQSLLTYQVINAAVPLSKIQGSKGPVQTASGAKVVIDGSASPIKFNDADVTAVSTTSNGSIYVVDKVLSPNPASAAVNPPATGPAVAAAAPATGDQVAAAQPAPDTNASAVGAAAATDSAAPASATTPPDGGAAAAAPASDQTVTTASAPVPDTPANRAKYGAPLSHAGRASQAAGN